MTRCKSIRVRSDAASMRHTVMLNDPQFMSADSMFAAIVVAACVSG